MHKEKVAKLKAAKIHRVYNWSLNRQQCGRGSERRAAHTQQTLTRVAPLGDDPVAKPLLSQIKSSYNIIPPELPER